MIAASELKRDFGTEVAVIILACRAFAGTANEDELKEFLQSNVTDWQLLYRIAAIHQLRPVVFKVLYKVDIPNEIKEQLQNDCKRIALHNLEHARELTQLYGRIEDAGITAIPWKGSIFCMRYYKDIGHREFSDIDFLIKPELSDLKAIKHVFENSRYIDNTAIPDDFLKTYFKSAREYYFDHYEDGERKFHAEFHWSTASQVFDFPTPMPNTLLFKGTEEINLFGKKITILNDTHHLLAMVAHHGLNQRWEMLKYTMDLVMLLKNGAPDPKEVTEASKTYGFNNALNIGLYIAEHLIGIKSTIPYTSPKNGRKYLETMLSSLNKARKGTSDTLLLNLKIKDSFADQVKMTGKYLRYATTPSVLDYKFIKLPRGLYFLYAFVKPIRFVTEYVKK